MAEAKDIRTQRTQDAQKFAQDQALGQAQLKTRQMAAQLDQQKISDQGKHHSDPHIRSHPCG